MGFSVFLYLILVYKGNVSIDNIIRIVAILISWPTAVILVCLVFFSRFREAIDEFLRNVTSIKSPWASVERQKNSPTNTKDFITEHADGAVTLSPEATKKVEDFIESLQKEPRTVQKNKTDDLENELATAYQMAYIWKFEYLKSFYVYNTKWVLSWFAKFSPQNKSIYHQEWQKLIPSKDERETILDVLVQFGMLVSDGLDYSVTEEGKAFLRYINYL